MQWLLYALLSAAASAITAILAKIGVEGVPSTLATAIRTVVILVIVWATVFALHEQRAIPTLSSRSVIFLMLSGVATGIAWFALLSRAATRSRIARGAHRQAEPAAHDSARVALAGRADVLASRRRRCSDDARCAADHLVNTRRDRTVRHGRSPRHGGRDRYTVPCIVLKSDLAAVTLARPCKRSGGCLPTPSGGPSRTTKLRWCASNE